ncbi:hypothetical protein OIDMADRAFT_40618 [Oidiodendron maius Zn]|uniref:Uncharacterized protein n=1 Tax=Oidiodendron maius (strain Zn) TaxID=913774 RepID=A0A0C3DL72_OIDMZ|nr:hypothetical protein OIDMADRAFT_40618 [Oidiodendron maius Zn]
MSCAILLPQIFIPVESIKLGQLVTSVDLPHQDYHDPVYSPTPVPIINTRIQYSSLGHKSYTLNFSLALTSLLSTRFSKYTKSRVYIKTNLAVSSKESRYWFKRVIDQGNDIYFVIGFYTVTDIQIIYKSIESNKYTGRLSLPVGLALNAAGVIAPLRDHINPQVGFYYIGIEGIIEHFKAPGEQIYTFQYRKYNKEEGVKDILKVETIDLSQLERE